MQAFSSEDLAVRIAAPGVEFRTKPAGDLTVGWMKLEQGVDLAPATKGLPDDLCQCPHWGYVITGKVRMKTAHGSQDYTAGEAFHWAPGHVPEALEDSEYVDFSPTEGIEELIAFLTRDG